jgi:hypothetical protein
MAGPIRADLGRPETPEERAARKAAYSRAYRESKTPNNLVIALIASLAIVLFLVLVVPRQNPAPAPPVDYKSLAAQAQPGLAVTLVAPALPSGWHCTSATLTPNADKSTTWYIGFVTPKQSYLAVDQGIDTTPAWLAGFLPFAAPTGTVTIGGISWVVYDQRSTAPTGNFAYSLYATVNGADFLIHGTADKAEVTTFTSALAAELKRS